MRLGLSHYLSPVTRKRLARFRRMRRAWLCFWILVALFGVSLCSELIANSNPLLVRMNGKWFFPVFFYYPESAFLPGGEETRPDYRLLEKSPAFSGSPGNFMVFAPVAYGPYESVDPASLQAPDVVNARFYVTPRTATLNLDPDGKVRRANGAGYFFGRPDGEVMGLDLNDAIPLSPGLSRAFSQRFANRGAGAFSEAFQSKITGKEITVLLPAYEPREEPPPSVRILLRTRPDIAVSKAVVTFSPKLAIVSDPAKIWKMLSPEDRQGLLESVSQRFSGPAEHESFSLGATSFRVDFEKPEVRFPFPPGAGHILGIDGAGRDVFARVLYGLRTSMAFGLILVLLSMVLGTVAGAVQGYYGGFLDITGQRIIEIWASIPFLYVMIFLGSVYGRSFALLLFCYAIFNWIGISYYMRAEFLRLRGQAFVLSARCLGVSTPRILFSHILPNALVPIITFFPFSLVGAIGSLAALDYLGFGLPPPTPSWGELLSQAQEFRWAWWLILYPSLALFIVMLAGVFIGEGVRNAFDPKPYARME
ncbi:MAG: ABC transporter permease subunit [Thermodesulfobacteriota bacterium]